MVSLSEKVKCGIKTKDGPLHGYIEESNERTYYKFKKIPYAKPPLGCLRFMPPSPIKPWTEEINCTEDALIPLSYSKEDKIEGSEDCLYIEISTPDIKPDKPLPVMFWVGCYGFCYYMDNIIDPITLNDQGVVFVRCGFRLGPFGFLSINDFMAPGNSGLKDVVMALKWVQRNISEFGGDPHNVTLFGNSAGGAIVHLMMLSPMAAGLFHKVIIQSVTALNTWSLAKNPKQPVLQLAKELGITKTCKMEIIEELKSISASEIMKAFDVLNKKAESSEQNDIFDAIFKPCIEQEFEGVPAFLSKSPPLIIMSGKYNKVPLIIGSNYIEGSVIEFVKKNYYHDFDKFNENAGLLVPRSLAGDVLSAQCQSKIGQQLLKFYLGGEHHLTEANRTQYIQLISDYYFLYYVNKTVRLHSQSAPDCPIFYYVINYAGEWSVPEELRFFNSLGHCAELPFIFGIKTHGSPVYKGSRDSVKTRDRVVKMWTNFAKYGNPTPDEVDPLLQITWDPVEHKEKLNYICIGAELTKGRNPFYDRMAFWDELHQEYTFLRALVHFNDMGVSSI